MVSNRFCFWDAKLRHLKMLNLVFGGIRGIWGNKFELGVRSEGEIKKRDAIAMYCKKRDAKYCVSTI